MDNVNFDNLNLHAKPMDPSTKNGMNTRRGNFCLFIRNRKKKFLSNSHPRSGSASKNWRGGATKDR